MADEEVMLIACTSSVFSALGAHAQNILKITTSSLVLQGYFTT